MARKVVILITMHKLSDASAWLAKLCLGLVDKFDLPNQRNRPAPIVDPLISQPARKPAHATLRIHRPPMHNRRPTGQVDPARLKQADHHPGQRLQMPNIEPLAVLAQHLNQGITQQRVFSMLHSPKLSASGNYNASCAAWKTRLTEFCQSIRCVALNYTLHLLICLSQFGNHAAMLPGRSLKRRSWRFIGRTYADQQVEHPERSPAGVRGTQS
jgi:hypothetical protein